MPDFHKIGEADVFLGEGIALLEHLQECPLDIDIYNVVQLKTTLEMHEASIRQIPWTVPIEELPNYLYLADKLNEIQRELKRAGEL